MAARKGISFIRLFSILFSCLGISLLLHLLMITPYVGRFFAEIAPAIVMLMFGVVALFLVFDDDAEITGLISYIIVHLIVILASCFVFQYVADVVVMKRNMESATYTQAVQRFDRILESKVGEKGIVGYSMWRMKRSVPPKGMKDVANEYFKNDSGIIDTVLNYIPHLVVGFLSINKWAGAVFLGWYYLATLVIGFISGAIIDDKFG